MNASPPGTGTLGQQIKSLRGQIAELTRRSPRSPACQIRPTGDQPLTANTDTAMGTVGAWSAYEDKSSMFTAGSPCYVTTLWDGYYQLHLHMAITGGGSGSTGACKILLGGTTVATESIATDCKNYPNAGADGIVLDALRTRIHLSAGQQLYWGAWTSAAATISANMFTQVRTELTVRYLGST